MNCIYHDVYVNSSKEEVFEKLADPSHLINWWPLKCSGEKRLGGMYNFYFEEAYDWWGQLTKYIPSESFHIKLTEADEDWNPTSFGFDLRPEGDGVWLEFWHKDWPEVNHHFRRSSHCWAMLLQGFKEYVEEGRVIPFGKRS